MNNESELSHERYEKCKILYRIVYYYRHTPAIFLRKYNNRLQIGRSLVGPAQSVVSSLNHIGVWSGVAINALLKNKDYVTKCLTDDCTDCTGYYSSTVIEHILICKCKCHIKEKVEN